MPTGPLLISLTLLAAALAAAAARRRRGFAGVLVLALALGGLLTAGGPEWAAGGLPPMTLGISAGLVLAGLGVVAWVARGRPLALGLAGGAVAASLGTLVPLVRQSGLVVPAASAAVLLGAATVLGLLGTTLRLGHWVRRLDTLLVGDEPVGQSAWDPAATRLLLLHALTSLLSLLAPHLHLLMLVAFGAGITGLLLRRRLTGRTPGPGAVAWAGLLGFSWWYFARVAGETPLALQALREGPFSPAFEVTAALPLALAAWPLLGLWPFHRSGLGPFAPLAGGALLVRLLAVALPNGLLHWQPVLYPLVVLAAWHALALRRDDAAVAALATLGLLSGVPAAGGAGIGLLAGAVLIRLAGLLPATGRELNWRGVIAAWLLAALGSLLLVPAIGAGLGAEALYSVLAVAGAVAAAWREAESGADGRFRASGAV